MRNFKESTLFKKWRNLWITIKYLFQIYCKTTTLHGFRYMINKNLCTIEKSIWATICLTSTGFCLYLMVISYKTVQSRRTIVQISDLDAPLHELDFPAVTICNFNKIYKPASYDLERKLQLSGYDNKTIDEFFQNLPQLIRPFREDVNYTKYNEMLYSLGITLKGLLFRLMQPCHKMIKNCFWDGKSYECSKLFMPVYSLMGHCCGYNYHVSPMYATRTNSPQCEAFYNKFRGYNNKYDTEHCDDECPGRTRILKIPGPGQDKGFHFEVDLEFENYRGSIRDYVGAAIIIHVATAFPEPDILLVTAQPEHQINIVLSASAVTSTDAVKKLSKTERNCVFPKEKYPRYSYLSCITGCKIKRMLAACDCIPYNYATPCVNLSGLCDFKNIDCIRRYQLKITQLYDETWLDNGKVLPPCDCDDTCDKKFYKMFVDKYRKIVPTNYPTRIVEQHKHMNTTHVKIFFRHNGYLKYELDIFMTLDNFIANLGGLISLCLGGSLISILEPLIYFLLRPLRHIRNQKIKSENNNND